MDAGQPQVFRRRHCRGRFGSSKVDEEAVDRSEVVFRQPGVGGICENSLPPNKVSSGLSDLLAEVFGPDRGIGGRATIGVMALAGGNCFETWATVELR